MITLTREEAQQVLYALEFDGFTAPDVTHNALVKTAIETLRDRLAEKEHEPVAWISKHGVVYPLDAKHEVNPVNELQPLYTAPQRASSEAPQREWKGLTDDEYELMAEKRVTNYFFNTLDYAHDIETKLKEKNT